MDSSNTSETTQKTKFEQNEEEIEAIISTLPKKIGWLSSGNTPLYCYKGFWYYELYVRGIIGITRQSDFNPSPSNIIISSTPKSGTTWLKALLFAIARRNSIIDRPEDNPLLKKVPHELIPYIEVSTIHFYDPSLPFLSTHIPYTSLPDSILDLGCKIVYICRDPKDSFISHWHFFKKLIKNKDITQLVALEEAFDLFCQGISSFGPYWDHVLGYWRAYLENPNKVMFLKYEDLINDTELHVKRLAEFIQFPFSVDEEREGVVGKIVELCSFESLSGLNRSGNFYLDKSFTIPRDSFFRKGKVGDWKNYLTEEMKNKIDQITVEKLGNYGLTF